MTKKERSEYFRTIGRKGGKATLKRYGKTHMTALAKTRWRTKPEK